MAKPRSKEGCRIELYVGEDGFLHERRKHLDLRRLGLQPEEPKMEPPQPPEVAKDGGQYTADQDAPKDEDE